MKKKVAKYRQNIIYKDRIVNRRNHKIAELEKLNTQLKEEKEVLAENSLPDIEVCIFRSIHDIYIDWLTFIYLNLFLWISYHFIQIPTNLIMFN